jgi:hypothetical protein
LITGKGRLPLKPDAPASSPFANFHEGDSQSGEMSQDELIKENDPFAIEIE